MNGIGMKVKLKLPHLAIARIFHFLGHFYLSISLSHSLSLSLCLSFCRAIARCLLLENCQFMLVHQTATMKYCSSNANFIELFSDSAWFGRSNSFGNTHTLHSYYTRLRPYRQGIFLWLLLHVVQIAAVCLFFGSFQRRLSCAEPKILRFNWKCVAFAQYRWNVMHVLNIEKNNNSKLFIFTLNFLSRKIVIHHAFWSSTLWTCLAVCLLMLAIKYSLCYEIHTINFSLQVVTCI